MQSAVFVAKKQRGAQRLVGAEPTSRVASCFSMSPESLQFLNNVGKNVGQMGHEQLASLALPTISGPVHP